MVAEISRTKSGKWIWVMLALAAGILAWVPRLADASMLLAEREVTVPASSGEIRGAEPERALALHEIMKNFEVGLRTEYILSEVSRYSDRFAGNFLLFTGERKIKSPKSPFYSGGRIGGGFFVNGGSELSGGIGYLGGMIGLEAGTRPSRLDVSFLTGVGGANVFARAKTNGVEEIWFRGRGFLILQPSVQWTVSTSPFSSLALSAAYSWIPFGDGWNLGGPTAAITFYFNR